jgi:hypothetical protein
MIFRMSVRKVSRILENYRNGRGRKEGRGWLGSLVEGRWDSERESQRERERERVR